MDSQNHVIVQWTQYDESRYELLQTMVDALARMNLWDLELDGVPSSEDVAKAEALTKLSERIDIALAGAMFLGVYVWVSMKTGSFTETLWLIGLSPFFVFAGVLLGWIFKKLSGFDKTYLPVKKRADRYKAKLDRERQVSDARIELAELELRRQRYEEEKVRRIRSKNFPEHWQSLRGYDLEGELAILFSTGNFVVSRHGGAGDGGVDLFLTRGDRRVVVQSKGWESRVGPEIVRELIGTMHIHRANEAWLVAVGGVTESAADLARTQRVWVISADTLAQMARGESSWSVKR